MLAAGPSQDDLPGDRRGRRLPARRRRPRSSRSTDRDGSGETLPVSYTRGRPRPVPRGPRGDRHRHASTTTARFMAEKDSLITKCPSKFSDEAAADPEHVDHRPVNALGSAALVACAPGRGLRGRRRPDRHPRRPPLGRLRPSRDLRDLRPAAASRRSRSRSPFVRTDLSVALVADHSSTTTPTLYKLTALWGSQAGSLLLWAFVLSIASSAVLFITRNRHREVVPWATAVLAGVAIFFIGLMVAGIFFPDAESWPFAASDPIPAEGAGLTPLLPPPGDGDPPADALLGLRLLHDPVRVRDRRADHPPPRRELDPLDPPLRARRLALPHRSASRSAPAGPTASSAGAATGPGTRSRTRP